MLVPKCIYRKSIFAKCTRLACLLSIASLLRRAPLATYRAHYADNYCHPMAATNALVIIVSKRANVFSALASFVKNQIPE